jgi:succinate dehydrogenase/fumarate reductase flavoprotein subunit
LSATYASGAQRCGAQLALSSGGKLSDAVAGIDDALAFWVPVSRFQRDDGTPVAFPHTVTDRAKPGLIAVNGRGQRFVNEAVSYHEFVRAQLRDQLRDPNHKGSAWLVCDKAFLWKYGLGRVRPFALNVRKDLKSGYLQRADSLRVLAERIGLPTAAFLETVETYNKGARDGVDRQFGRGSDIYQRHLGDADCQPNPCIAPVEHAPFYAVEVFPADLGMAAGIMTDGYGCVLREDGHSVPGLYACGNDMHSVMNGAYPGPGITLGPALVFGYLSAMHACKKQIE